MSSDAEVIICYCLKCGLKVGIFDNSWEGLGKTYYIPKVVRDATGLKGVGSIKLATGPAQVGTIIENSSLQDLACANCREVFGLLCDNAPEGHLFKKGQLLICAKKISMKLQQTGGKATLSVTKTHDLKKSSNKSSSLSRRPSSILPGAPGPSEITRQSVEKPFTPAASSPSILGDAKIMSAICEQRKDIDRIDAAVGRLEDDMQCVKIFMENMRRETNTIQDARLEATSVVETLQHDLTRVTEKADGVNDLRAELDSLNTSVEQMKKPNRRNNLHPEFNSLRTRVDEMEKASIGNDFRSEFDSLNTRVEEMEGASVVDDLRTELDSLRTRVKEMEKASRKASTSDARVIATPAPSDEVQEGQVLPKLISNERCSPLNKARDFSVLQSSRSLHRKRRYSKAEDDQMEIQTSKLAELEKYKRRKETEAQQNEDTGSLSIPPTRSPSREPASPSKPRIESPILGRYDTNSDVHRTKQDDNIQHVEHDTERQISESPSQQIASEMNTPNGHNDYDVHQQVLQIAKANAINTPNEVGNIDEHQNLQIMSKAAGKCSSNEPRDDEGRQYLRNNSKATQTINLDENSNNEEHQNLQQVSQATSNTLLDSSQALSPAQQLNISPANSNGNQFTSHLDQPQHHHRSRKQLEIPNSSQSESSQHTQEQQLPSNSRRGPGRPKAPPKRHNLFTPHKQDRSAANAPHSARGLGHLDDASDIEMQSTAQSHPRRGRPKGVPKKPFITPGTISNGPGSEELSTLGRALRGRILPVPNSSPLVREFANKQSNLVIDLSSGNEREGSEPPGDINESLTQTTRSQKTYVSVPLNSEKENPSRPAKRQRRNTRNSRQRPSVDLDKALASRPESGNITSDEAVESDSMDTGNERQTRSISKRSREFKGSPVDDDDNYVPPRSVKYYNNVKRKRAQSEQSKEEDREGGKGNENADAQDNGQERQGERGRGKERPKEQERRERRKSTRRREVESREELVQEALGREGEGEGERGKGTERSKDEVGRERGKSTRRREIERREELVKQALERE
ncbi:uncharacterized protein EAE97_008496 [Botrytis byssoidea]|uniref:Yippee/Mis18/Cereblon domain-containing protein n=1 Tax=Botrytis byssoidea TaxID=139641 RepID=A0A9P5IDB7_9HELO|nr:uncharacterized protein EAE97_008496 [Botrytis byssoidea]KAF7934136.1 hypothetical protein EAE97_008496 [Botrytis byssoidea]